MLGCEHDARMRCYILSSIPASHPSIAHRVRKGSWISYALFSFRADIVFLKLNFNNYIVIASVCISFHTCVFLTTFKSVILRYSRKVIL